MKRLFIIKIGGNVVDDEKALQSFLKDFPQLREKDFNSWGRKNCHKNWRTVRYSIKVYKRKKNNRRRDHRPL